ncbi:MAG: ribonuclease Z [Oscillospiraceae bacterium]|nr:ribonuclease Z [Oscillospiraceae bacterium]
MIGQKIKFVSTGGIFDYEIGNSSMLINTGIGNILIDCGYTVYKTLCKKELVDKIDYILITHLHGDHIGSIHPLILHLVNKCKKNVKIIYPTESFLNQLKNYFHFFLIDVERYIEFIDIKKWDNIGFVNTSDFHVKGMESYAYYFKTGDWLIYYSGDLGNLEITESFLNSMSYKNVLVFHEVSFINGSAHVYYRELMRLAEKYNVFAYHCNHLLAPEDCNLQFVADYKIYCAN